MEEQKEVKIQIPERYEIDKENSTFECIKFKLKKLTYKDVAKKLFTNNNVYYNDEFGCVKSTFLIENCITNPNNATSAKQVEKLLAINKLINVTKYLNDDWKPKFDNSEDIFVFSITKDEIHTEKLKYWNLGVPYFKSQKLAKQAIKILGEKTIKLALSTDW